MASEPNAVTALVSPVLCGRSWPAWSWKYVPQEAVWNFAEPGWQIMTGEGRVTLKGSSVCGVQGADTNNIGVFSYAPIVPVLPNRRCFCAD